jgi:hypothetical protein
MPLHILRGFVLKLQRLAFLYICRKEMWQAEWQRLNSCKEHELPVLLCLLCVQVASRCWWSTSAAVSMSGERAAHHQG